jgi:hypothetical protein
MSIGSKIQRAVENAGLARVSWTGQTVRCPNQSRSGLLRTVICLSCLACLSLALLTLMIRIAPN